MSAANRLTRLIGRILIVRSLRSIEIVSNTKRDELDGKLKTYAEIGICYYAVYDPECQLGKTPLRVFNWTFWLPA
ncbi:MAG: hypothetical protein GY862_20920 [Gammaproteobacteria bacterium]|nr:hypothetical protein [Gammaproteobacteria bacterium]